jgi:hypothetical protein
MIPWFNQPTASLVPRGDLRAKRLIGRPRNYSRRSQPLGAFSISFALCLFLETTTDPAIVEYGFDSTLF